MISTSWIMISAGALLLGLLIILIGIRLGTPSVVARRLQEFVQVPTERQAIQQVTLQARRRELRGSLRSRVISPTLKRIGIIISKLLPGNLSETMSHQLEVADHPFGLQPRSFYILRLVFAAMGIIIAFSIIKNNFFQGSMAALSLETTTAPAGNSDSTLSLLSILASFLMFYLMINFPKTWLKRKARIRQDKIRRALPDALDMLSVCADAGLGFDQSIQRVSEYWTNDLSQELRRMVRELGMGVQRRIALRNMAERLDVTELSSFVAVIIQSERLGMSITETLHSQANQMRIERRFRAQEEARKMPLKMLFPLILLIFPAMFAVILGPMIPVLGSLFRSLQGG